MRPSAAPITVERRCPMWNGFAMFGDEKSMTMFLPVGAAAPNGAVSFSTLVTAASASAARRKRKFTNGPATATLSITSSGVTFSATSAAILPKRSAPRD